MSTAGAPPPPPPPSKLTHFDYLNPKVLFQIWEHLSLQDFKNLAQVLVPSLRWNKQTSRPTSFHDLPAELFLMIYEHIGLHSFMNLALTIYPTLYRHGLVPPLTPETVVGMFSQPQSTSSAPRRPVSRMPHELWLQTAEYLEPTDAFALVFGLANQSNYFQYPLSTETIMSMFLWCSRFRRR